MNGRSGKNGKTPALRAFGILRGGHLAGWKLFQTVFLLAMCLLIAPANAMAANMQLTDQAGLLAEEDGKAIVRQIEKMCHRMGYYGCHNRGRRGNGCRNLCRNMV